ncbi:MAG: ABC transporter permease [Rubricella sp.]
MTRILPLAWRSLMHEKLHLLCNIAIICGVLVPLLVLQGVKTGVYSALIADLEANPDLLLVSTLGDQSFSEADAAEVAAWPETGFVVPRTRGIADTVLIQSLAGGPIREASAVPTAPGDPVLPDGAALEGEAVALTALLAERAGIAGGERIRIVVRSEARARPLVFEAPVAVIVPRTEMTGTAILIDIERLDAIEAYYDGYALPQYGLEEGRDPVERAIAFEGLRLYARSVDDVARLEERIGARFGVATRSEAAAIERTLSLGRNLDRALFLIAATAMTGLVAALVFGFWAEVQRKRQVLATFALIGLTPGQIARLPLVQALLTGAMALAAAFVLFLLAAELAEALFAEQLPGDRRLVLLTGGDALRAAALTLGSVGLSSIWATRAALATDPAIVFRS